MRESTYKIPGGKLVKVKLQVSSEKIAKVTILGDFFLHPEETLQKIENSLLGSTADETLMINIIAQTLADSEATLIGVTAVDIAKTIMLAWGTE